MIPEIIIYLLKVNTALVLFYAGYYLILGRYTFYTLNRLYLLTGLIYSALYPLIDFSAMLNRNEHLKERIIMLTPDWQGSVTYIANQSQDRLGNYWELILLLFWTGVIFMSLRLMLQLLSLFNLHLKSRSTNLDGFKFRSVSKAVNPFSFWRTIYLNPECHDPRELPSILEHEQIHVRQLHTADVMLAELSTIFYWFNPGVWLMKRAIKANLEFITDQEVIRSGISAKEYQYALLRSQALPQTSIPVNNFHFLTIKKRIAMINKKPSHRINLSKYVLLPPSIMLLVLMCGISKAEFPGSVVEALAQLPKISHVPLTLQNGGPASQPLQINTQNKAGSRSTKGTSKGAPTPALDTNKIVNGVVVVTGRPLKNVAKASLIQLDTNVVSKPLYVLDGQVITKAFNKISAERIESIRVVKGEGAIKQYGSDAKNGVVEITTKNKTISDAITYAVAAEKQSETQKISLGDITSEMIILNGKEITKEQLDGIKVTSIGTIEVFKGSSAVTKYGEKAKAGVIVITTK